MTHRHLVSVLTFCVALATAAAPPAGGQTEGRSDLTISALKRIEQRMMLQRARAKMARAREAATHRGKAKPSGVSSRRSREETPGPSTSNASPELRRRVQEWRAQALAPNVRANDPAGDGFGVGQAEQSIAASGTNVLIAWNDGHGFEKFPPTDDVIGFGYSTDGGASFTDGGVPAKLLNWTWTSDPVVTVNERTGTFYFCGLVDSTAGQNGIAIVPATFPGGVFTWGTPRMIRKVTSSTTILDKQWMVADSTSDSLYISYTTITVSSDQIDFQRSPNGVGWVAATKLSSTADNGWVQGSRPAVGPAGELYVTWAAIGPVDVDFFRIRKSTNYGATFGAEVTIPSGGVPASGYFGNFGSGAPGFNRERGITFPSINVDRSTGSFRGRVYVTWNEGINFYDDVAGGAGAISEPEGVGSTGVNDAPGSATLFTVNNTVRGDVASADLDYFKFSATQGQTGVFYVDSGDVNLDLAFRVFCSDGITRLAISDPGGGPGGLIVFTFPTTDNYYLRCAGFSGTTGGYRIHTKFSVTGTERARDHRDVFVTSSTNGTVWTVPVRVNTDPGYYDNWLPEVAVSSQGRVYCIWYDWRDAAPSTCGGESNIYMSRSDDGGATWVSLGLISDATSPWTSVSSNIAPNQGDYLALFANDIAVYPAWADGRAPALNPEIYTVALPLALTPTLISLVRADAEPERVTLTWYASGSEGLEAVVYRRTETSDWTALGAAPVPGNGQLTYTDAAVTAGARYGYRLGILERGAESFHGETWVDVPTASFALNRIQPNPAARDLWVAFTLPARAPATLTLLDLAGRIVRTREVGEVAGARRVNLGEGGLLPVGVYVVRLTQGGRTLTTRVSVVR